MPFGAQLSSSGGLSSSVGRARAIGAECLQVFLCAPQRWQEPSHTTEEVQRFVDLCCESGLGPNFVHAAYLINLASPDPVIRTRSVAALTASAEWSTRCGLDGVVVHLGSARAQPLADAERAVVEGLHTVLTAIPAATVLLENSAGAGETLGARFEQIGRLVRDLDAGPALGVCLDTAHAFAAGYDLRTPAGHDELLEGIEQSVGMERLRLIHANDSKSGLGSGLDRHENIGTGQIGEEAFERLLRHPFLARLPWVLEVPGSGDGPDVANMQTLRRLAGVPPTS